MIVDDSTMIRSRIARLVSHGQLPGVEVVAQARDGADALAQAGLHRPDIATLDLTMPEMDGVTCIPALLRLLPELRILVVSALTDKSTAIQALRLGARGFVGKPFADDELRLALLDLLEN
jgi:two-component system chemotaxis response regulator CheY